MTRNIYHPQVSGFGQQKPKYHSVLILYAFCYHNYAVAFVPSTRIRTLPSALLDRMSENRPNNGMDSGSDRRRPMRNPDMDMNKMRRTQNRSDVNRSGDGMQQRLESSLSSLFDMTRLPSDGGGRSSGRIDNSIQDPSDDGNVDDILSIGSNREAEDAPQLGQDIYLNSDRYMDENGSIMGQKTSDRDEEMKQLLSKLVEENPQIPEEVIYNNNSKRGNGKANQSKRGGRESGPIIDDQALLRSLSQNESKNKPDAEELHQKVFANEKGFLQQSELFRDTLSPAGIEDERKKNEAAAWRRGTDYRRRQDEALSMMEKEMEDLEGSLLSKEDARQLASKEIHDQDCDEKTAIIICSQCSALMTSEEMEVERMRGRTSISDMICRQCQVENMEARGGSPYLMGRLGRNGKMPPRASIPEPSDRYRRQIQQIRNISPQTEEPPGSEGPSSDDAQTQGKQRTPQQADAWRAQFHAAMQQQQERITRRHSGETGGPNPSGYASNKKGTKARRPNHRYSSRTKELMKHRKEFPEKAWNAHFAAALYRQQCIEQTGVAFSEESSGSSSTGGEENVQELLRTIKELKAKVDLYEKKLQDSSFQMKNLKNDANNEQRKQAQKIRTPSQSGSSSKPNPPRKFVQQTKTSQQGSNEIRNKRSTSPTLRNRNTEKTFTKGRKLMSNVEPTKQTRRQNNTFGPNKKY